MQNIYTYIVYIDQKYWGQHLHTTINNKNYQRDRNYVEKEENIDDFGIIVPKNTGRNVQVEHKIDDRRVIFMTEKLEWEQQTESDEKIFKGNKNG